ncbi:MAG: hypothetical protein HZC54_17520 [Verrucomicrobia bacterium]|nr:hypothetical protein [Verrucomicrobiota bacterium]
MKQVILALLALNAAVAVADEPSYPRIANFYGAQIKRGMVAEKLEFLAKYQLIVGVGDLGATNELARLKAKNPSLIVLHYISVRGQPANNPLMKESFWLLDPAGQRISPWPGRALPNQTLPEVNEVMVRMAREALEQMPQLDGIFLDSYYRHIAHMKKGRLDADRDGKADDAAKLNDAWTAGLLRVARGIRALRPNLIVMANGGAPIDFACEELNGVLFEDQLTFLEEAGKGKRPQFKRSADELLAAYQKWESVPHRPHVTALVDGGGDIANPWEWEKLSWKDKTALVEKARHNEPRMRFNLCFALMGNGYAAFDYHTTSRGQHWWFAEWDTKLGRPRGPMQKRAGYWLREFDGATVFVNPFKETATVKEGGGFTLAPFDGKLLRRNAND